MTVHYVGIGGIGVVRGPEDVLKTMALGSCVAIMLLDPVRRIVGMDHVALPDSSIDPAQARERPGHFADTGLPALLAEMGKAGFVGDGRSLIVKLAGGAAVIEAGASFDIGRRNVLAIKKLLWARRMGAVAEDIGGNISRTVEVSVSEGRVHIHSPGRGSWEI
ncbi:MAG: chemotaxis protein CheD [Deltaproteobacteria bacterium]|nr:chemotaxis protein CheD [Deltaproteobacteria bacterium]